MNKCTPEITYIPLESSSTVTSHLPAEFCLVSTHRGGSGDTSWATKVGRVATTEQQTEAVGPSLVPRSTWE